MHFLLKVFDKLTTIELFEIYKLRLEVFVVEQNCAYQDVDDKDLVANHLMLFEEGNLLAYCRIIPPTIVYKNTAIGRVVVNSRYRKKKFGKMIMQEAIDKSAALFGGDGITISAQTYLLKFYEELGFYQISKEYLEDNIPHIKMEFKYVKT